MKRLSVFVAYFFFMVTLTYAQSFKWADQIGGTDYDTGEDIAVDSIGNVYLVGIFNSTGDFDPGAGTYNLTSAGAQDVYVMKLDSNGNFIWAARVGGSHQDFSYSIGLNNNSVYICGNFRDTADFDPGIGISNLISAGGSDIFILKLDTASNFMWAKQIGGTGDDVAEKLTIDNAGNILVCGQFQNTADFDPGAGVQNMTSSGSADAYILKLNSNGNYVWSGQYGNNPGQFASSIATDANNDIYVTGQFYGTTDFDPGAGTYNMTASGFYANIYVLKWTSAGNFAWAGNMGNSSGGDQGIVIRTDGSGNPVVTGSYYGTVDFDPGAGIYNLTATGTNGDIFVLKLESLTGAFIFAKSMGGTTLDQPYAMTINSADHIYVAGLFSTTADFDPGVPTYNLVASGPGDAFIVELDNAGDFLWAYGFGGTDNDFARGITAHESDVYTSGVFAYTADFNPGIPVYNLSSYSNSSDAFLFKLRFCTPMQTNINYSLCPGDSIFAGGAYQHNPGLYIDYYTAANGCDSIVSTVIQYTFLLNLGNDVDACIGQSVLLDANVAGASYLWNTGATTPSITVITSGSYWVEVTLNNCVQADTIMVIFHPLPIINLGMDTMICANASVTIDAGPGFSTYLWQDGSTGQTFTLNGSVGAGTYTLHVTVTNSFGCSNDDFVNVTVDPCTGIETLNANSFKFYPNPANDFILIQSDEKINEVIFFNILGEQVLQQCFNGEKQILKVFLNSMDNGIYYVQIKSENSLRRMKLLIQHWALNIF